MVPRLRAVGSSGRPECTRDEGAERAAEGGAALARIAEKGDGAEDRGAVALGEEGGVVALRRVSGGRGAGEDDSADGELASGERLEGEAGGVDGAEAGASDEDDRELEGGDEVDHIAAAVDGDEEAASALDDQRAAVEGAK